MARGGAYHNGALQERLRNAGVVRCIPAIEDVRVPYPARGHVCAVPEAGLIEALRERIRLDIVSRQSHAHSAPRPPSAWTDLRLFHNDVVHRILATAFGRSMLRTKQCMDTPVDHMVALLDQLVRISVTKVPARRGSVMSSILRLEMGRAYQCCFIILLLTEVVFDGSNVLHIRIVLFDSA